MNLKCWNADKSLNASRIWADPEAFGAGMSVMYSRILNTYYFKMKFGIRFRFRLHSPYLSKVFKACLCLYKRKLYANAVRDASRSLSPPSAPSFFGITHRFKSKDTDVSYLICKCEFLECHVTYIDTASSQCFSSSSSFSSSLSAFNSEMQTMYLYWKTMLKTTETMMMNAVAKVWMAATLSLCEWVSSAK